ncbi:hypothetical protein [Frankia sp. AgB1.9]|nr:hypothetical protein [Frankia sp. AgB1.9]
MALLTSGRLIEPGLHQVNRQIRETIARDWLNAFNGEGETDQ